MNNPPREEDINDHECVKAISEMLDIYEEDKSRISIVEEETVNPIYLFIHPVKLDGNPTEVVSCKKCETFLPREVVAKSDYDHKCLQRPNVTYVHNRFGDKFKSANLESIPARGNVCKRYYKCKLCEEIFK